jgi:NAD(P)-dependent dehydrogenase (short-subunit alcohol dehydrogenase family)
MTMFDGKVAVVTGAARGLGRDYAEHFAADGAAVVLADVDADRAEAAAKALADRGARAHAVAVDITDESSALDLVGATVGRFGGLDLLVNNAALWGDLEHMADGVLDTPVDYFRRVVDVNLTGAFVVSKAAVPAMRERGSGRIVNVSSIGAWMSGGPYGITKLALHQLTYACAVQLAGDGITVNAVAPGMIHNEATQRQVPDEVFAGMVEAMVPLKRAGTSRDMYGAIRWLCSDDAAFVTGQVISPNGGSHARF